MTLAKKECHELRDAFQFLRIWRERFDIEYGVLEGISHLSNPDDPPDVIAHFSVRDVSIEITTIDPSHILQSDALHRKMGNQSGRSEIPLSCKPKNRQEAIEMMYCPGSAAWENVSDRNQVWLNSIIERVSGKLTNSRIRKIQPGIILLPGRLDGSIGEEEVIKQAFSDIRAAIPDSAAWTLATCHQWNEISYFSAIDTCGAETAFRRGHG